MTKDRDRPGRQAHSLFEPGQPDPPPPRATSTVAGPPQSVQPPRPPRRRLSAWLLAPMLTLVVGAVLGFALGSTQAGRQPAAVAPASSASTVGQQAPPPSTEIVVRHYASPACLEAVMRGDRMVHLLIRNQRGQAERLLVAYTLAARQCCRDASPTP